MCVTQPEKEKEENTEVTERSAHKLHTRRHHVYFMPQPCAIGLDSKQTSSLQIILC